MHAFALTGSVLCSALVEVGATLEAEESLRNGDTALHYRWGYEEQPVVMRADLNELCSPNFVMDVADGLHIPLAAIYKAVTDMDPE